jgi:hypothetical protein
MYSPRRLGCFLARLVMLHHLSQHHREGPVDVVVSPANIQHSKSKYYIHQYQPATSRHRKPWLSYACPSRTTRSLPSLRHSSAPSNDLPASVNVSKVVLIASGCIRRTFLVRTTSRSGCSQLSQASAVVLSTVSARVAEDQCIVVTGLLSPEWR